MDLFSEAVRAIQAEYIRLGHTRDWRFLASPRKTLAPGTRAAFFTLNPGEGWIDPDHGRESSEGGSAFLRERWKGHPAGEAPLQIQFKRLFAWLGLIPEETLTAYFIPFRSRDYKTLPSRSESMAFSVGLWRKILPVVRPLLVVCLGDTVAHGLHDIWGPALTERQYETGWGDVHAYVSVYTDWRLLQLPHLSRFPIFGRPQSVEPLARIREALGYPPTEAGHRPADLDVLERAELAL
jgi:hypothetical protein